MKVRKYQFIFKYSFVQDTEIFLFYRTNWALGQIDIWMKSPFGESSLCHCLSPLITSLPMYCSVICQYLSILSSKPNPLSRGWHSFQRIILNCWLISFCCSRGIWVENEEGRSDLGDLCELGVEDKIHSFTYETWLRVLCMPGIVLGAGNTVIDWTCSLS